MSRGHGDLGLLENLRTISDLIDESGADRRPYLGYFPGIQVTGWIVDSGRTYVARAHYVFDGMLRDIMAVQTDIGGLTRVETLAACRSAAGTYFADIDAARFASPTWDDGVTTWDGTTTFDGTPPLDLYVHLAGDADPAGVTVVALLGFFFAGKGESYPVRWTDLLTNGDSDTAAWGAVHASGPGLTSGLDTSIFKSGAASTFLRNDGSGAGPVSRNEDKTLVVGARYVLAGYYRTDAAFSANLSPALYLGDTADANNLDSAGRDIVGSGAGFALTPTNGEWRAFWFEFLAPFATTRIMALILRSGAGAGQFNIDRFSLRRIYRHAYWEPRLDQDGLAEVELGPRSIFYDFAPVGLGSVQLIDADGVLAPIFGQLLLSGQPATVYVGGAFADGQEVQIDDWRAEFGAVARNVSVDDSRIVIDLDDQITLALDRELPPRTMTTDVRPNMDANVNGARQPIVLGNFNFGLTAEDAVPLLRIDKTTAGYGVYSLCDVDLTTGLATTGTATVYQYFTSNHLKNDIAHPSALLVAGTDYSVDYSTGLLTILRNIKDFGVDASGTPYGPTGQFNIGAGTLTPAAFASGSAEAQVSGLTTAWTAAAGVAITWTYDTATHKFTVSKAAGTLNLLCNSGNADYQTFWDRHGFNTSADKTGALSYTSDKAVFTSPEQDHFFSVMHYGLKDDASGTFTGTPNALIEKPGDLFGFLLSTYVRATVAQASIVAARANAYASKNCRVYLGATTTVKDVLFWLGVSGLAQIVVDGTATWYYLPYTAGTPADVVDFFDRDYLTFKCSRRTEDLYAKAQLAWGQRPLSGVWRTRQYVYDSGIPVKYTRGAVLEVHSALATNTGGNVDTLGQAIAKLAASSARVVEFSARGKLVGMLPGKKIRITRARALDPTGQLNAVLFRVLSLRRGLISGITTCLAVEDVSFA